MQSIRLRYSTSGDDILFKSIIFLTKPIRYWWDSVTYTRKRRKKLESLKDKFKGQPLIIVGNGPSLNKTPLGEFLGVPSIGMNKINLLFDRTEWRPSLILCANNLVSKQNEQFYSETNIPIYLSWKNRFFINREAKRNVQYYLSDRGMEFKKDLTESVGAAGTVTYTALQFAYYTGANPVILFGVDHSFSVNDSSKSNDIEKMTTEDSNHFHKDYFAKGQYWGIPNLERSEIGFKMAKDAFESDNRNVFDATIGGKLNIFKRVSLEEALSLCDANK